MASTPLPSPMAGEPPWQALHRLLVRAKADDSGYRAAAGLGATAASSPRPASLSPALDEEMLVDVAPGDQFVLTPEMQALAEGLTVEEVRQVLRVAPAEQQTYADTIRAWKARAGNSEEK